ncbi:TPA: hypothetical protein NNQ18_004593 [Salmonella enterica]|nr:hypothetical protein [Salmonella enterica]
MSNADKCREEFEKYLDDNKMFMNINRVFNQSSNEYEYCAIQWIWGSWQHQQAKVEELQNDVSIMLNSHKRMSVGLLQQQQAKVKELQNDVSIMINSHKRMSVGLLQQQSMIEELIKERDELQKQVDAALKKLDKRRDELWSKWKWQADMQDQGAANAFEEAYWILEQALKGENND